MSQEIENNFEERKKDWDLTGLLDDVKMCIRDSPALLQIPHLEPQE